MFDSIVRRLEGGSLEGQQKHEIIGTRERGSCEPEADCTTHYGALDWARPRGKGRNSRDDGLLGGSWVELFWVGARVGRACLAG